MPKPDEYLLMTADAWAAMKEEMVAQTTLRAGDKVGVEFMDEEAGTWTAHRPLYLALQAEMDAYAVILEQEFLKFNMARATDKDYAPYGQPLTHGTDGRYEFWPSMKAKMPLLYYCAASCWLLMATLLPPMSALTPLLLASLTGCARA